MTLKRLIPLVFCISLAYAIIRYNVFKGVPLDHLPMYVMNKVVSMTALFLIGLSNVVTDNKMRSRFGMAGLAVASLHVLMSQILLSPEYYSKLFASSNGVGGYSFSGELSLLAGTLGFFIMLLMVFVKCPDTMHKMHHWLVRSVLALVALHCLCYGWSSWWTPDKWPGFLPPITLLSFLFAIVTLVLGFLKLVVKSSK